MYWFRPLTRGHPSWKATFLVKNGCPHCITFVSWARNPWFIIHRYRIAVDSVFKLWGSLVFFVHIVLRCVSWQNIQEANWFATWTKKNLKTVSFFFKHILITIFLSNSDIMVFKSYVNIRRWIVWMIFKQISSHACLHVCSMSIQSNHVLHTCAKMYRW